MKNEKLMNRLVVVLTALIIMVMVVLTWGYLSHQKEIKDVGSSVHKVTKSVVKKTMNETVNDQKGLEKSAEQSKPSVEAKVETKTSEQTVASKSKSELKYRYLYVAAGGDTLETVRDLTGVDVDTLASVNNVAKDVVLVANQEIYVP